MPRKRAAPASSSGSSTTKRPRQSTDRDDSTPDPPLPPTKRWSEVSASRNADHKYKLFTETDKAYEFHCLYDPAFRPVQIDDDEDHEEEDKENRNVSNISDTPTSKSKSSSKKPEPIPLDVGTEEMEGKPASEYPNHPYTMTCAGNHRLHYIRVHSSFRNPGTFGLHTFNDHMAYGAMEVIENIVLDYEEASKAGNYREQWAICEAIAVLFSIDGAPDMTMCDAGEQVDDMIRLLGRMFLHTLAQFERRGLLPQGEDAEWEIKNLGMIMGLFLGIPSEMHQYGLLEESLTENVGPLKDKKWWRPHQFDRQILAYAKKYGIRIIGPPNIEEVIERVKEGDLPVTNTAKSDVFGFKKALRKYKARYAGVGAFFRGLKDNDRRSRMIGGDALDITTWSSAERKKHSFKKKDPLDKKDLDALKEGLVLEFTWD
ncbi:hypothetical protein V8F20_010092 [Naviculisporaceae sp. PSN 640]